MDYGKKFLVEPGDRVRLKDHDPDFHGRFRAKADARAELRKNHQRLTELQHRLYAESKRSLLIVLQAMDAGGKDGTIRHVMGPLNPQGCRVTSFKAPTDEELAHDFLWRIHKVVPRKGEIGIFNRSHYEDEKLLADTGTTILKFYLHISKAEQRQRFQARLNDPEKHWKANPADFEDRKLWEDYQAAFEEALAKCSKPWAPWFIIPANHKWFRNLVISKILVETLEGLDLRFPKPAFDPAELSIP
jgi:polyphosphate kinase 2 (PPK2 family)